ADVAERFSPGSYVKLSDSEALNRPPFDVLASGRMLSFADPPLSEGKIVDPRTVEQIIIKNGVPCNPAIAKLINLAEIPPLVTAGGRLPSLSDAPPLITATQEAWRATSTPGSFDSATAAHQFVRYNKGIAQPSADAAAPLDLVGV